MTTANQLRYFMRKKPDFGGVIAKDQLMETVEQQQRSSSSITLIVNTDTQNLPGTHWVALHLLPAVRWVKYFDPLAWIPDVAICKQLQKLGYTNIYFYRTRSQDLLKTNCGPHVVYFLYNLKPAPPIGGDASALFYINKVLI